VKAAKREKTASRKASVKAHERKVVAPNTVTAATPQSIVGTSAATSPAAQVGATKPDATAPVTPNASTTPAGKPSPAILKGQGQH
jgi:hypothetical protein